MKFDVSRNSCKVCYTFTCFDLSIVHSNRYTNPDVLNTVMILSFQTDMSEQTGQTQIRLLLEEQSDQGLYCLLFHLHLFDEIP